MGFISRDVEESKYPAQKVFSKAKKEDLLEEEEPFDFSQLPDDLLCKIVEKFSYKDFSVLDRTSRLGNTICWEKSFSPKHDVSEITVHKKNGTTAETLELVEHITFKPEDLDRLIKAAKPSALLSQQFVPRQFFEIESVQNLLFLNLQLCSFTDNELLGLKCTDIFVGNDFITANGLNRFLKQWKNRERDLEQVDMLFDASAGTRNFEEILDGLEANPIWTPDFHEHSFVGKIKHEEFRLMFPENQIYIYSLCRSDDITDTIALRLSRDRFVVTDHRSGENFVISHLSNDQYFSVIGRCRYCQGKACNHSCIIDPDC